METSSLTGPGPAAATGDTDVPIVVDEAFENIYDVPFIVVNKVGGKIIAEVTVSESQLVTRDRIQEAQEVARRHGWHVFASKHGDIEYEDLPGVILMHFTPDLDGGL